MHYRPPCIVGRGIFRTAVDFNSNFSIHFVAGLCDSNTAIVVAMLSLCTAEGGETRRVQKYERTDSISGRRTSHFLKRLVGFPGVFYYQCRQWTILEFSAQAFCPGAPWECALPRRCIRN